MWGCAKWIGKPTGPGPKLPAGKHKSNGSMDSMDSMESMGSMESMESMD